MQGWGPFDLSGKHAIVTGTSQQGGTHRYTRSDKEAMRVDTPPGHLAGHCWSGAPSLPPLRRTGEASAPCIERAHRHDSGVAAGNGGVSVMATRSSGVDTQS